MFSEERQRRLAELREIAERKGGLYVGDALEYAQLLGQVGLTKPNITRIAKNGHIRRMRPPGTSWEMYDIDSLDEFFGETTKHA